MKKHCRKHRIWIAVFSVIVLLGMVFMIYVQNYYHADPASAAALRSDPAVTVSETDYGWFFDGPSETDAVIFYPGGKVEETAYAILLHELAAEGMDACLVRMPFRLAVFGKNKADQVMKEHTYDRWYIGGHSLGGVMAADYAAEHGTAYSGIYLLASYPAKQLKETAPAIMIYHFGKSTTPDQLDQTWVNCLNLFGVEYNA